MKYRPLSQEIAAPTSAGTASTVSDSNVVRAVNTSSTVYLLSITDADGNVQGTMTLVGSEVAFIDKGKTQKIFAANAAVKLSPVSYPS